VWALLALGALQVGLVALRLPGWPCALRAATGIPCPGCGLSRALAALARGEWQAALAFHAFAPLFAAAGLLLLGTAVLRGPARVRLAQRVASVEARTGLVFWLGAALLVYWAVRLLYHPLTFQSPR
jgi:hypothetical protein